MDQAEGMIAALQYPPGEDRNDGKIFGENVPIQSSRYGVAATANRKIFFKAARIMPYLANRS
jgi:hypothetical protein